MCFLAAIACAFTANHPLKNLPFSAIKNCNSLKDCILKQIKISGLLKGAAATRCRNLTLVMMQGEQRDIQVGEYIVRCVPVTDWRLKR